jgi:DNA-binding PadR family transcriptional regulator
MAELSNELMRGTVVPIVLSLLSEREMYGYEIVKLVNARSNGLLEWKEGTLYPTLHKLEGERLIGAAWREGPSGKQRKYYGLTRRGEAELANRREEWQKFSGVVSTLLFGA